MSSSILNDGLQRQGMVTNYSDPQQNLSADAVFKMHVVADDLTKTEKLTVF
jgi:hypothetical protein